MFVALLIVWRESQDKCLDLMVEDVYMGAATYYVKPTEAGLDLDMNGLMLNLVAE